MYLRTDLVHISALKCCFLYLTTVVNAYFDCIRNALLTCPCNFLQPKRSVRSVKRVKKLLEGKPISATEYFEFLLHLNSSCND